MYECWHVLHVSTHWKNIVLWSCSDGGSVEHSPSSAPEVDDLLDLSLDTSDSEDDDWWVEQPACHWVHQQSEGMYSNLWRVSEKLPYTWRIYFIIHEFYGSSVSVYAAWCLAHRPMHHHNVCVIFHGIYSVKEVNVSVTVVCSSSLIYNNTWSLLSFIMPHRLKHCLNLIHHHTLELSFTHPNTCSSIAHFWSHSKIQLKMINFDLQCWCGMALSHVYCHAGLPSHVKSCQVLKCGHNEKE